MIEAPFSEPDYSSDCLDEFHGFTDEEDHGDGFNDGIGEEAEDELNARLGSKHPRLGNDYSSKSDDGGFGEIQEEESKRKRQGRKVKKQEGSVRVQNLDEDNFAEDEGEEEKFERSDNDLVGGIRPLSQNIINENIRQ